MGTDYRYLQAFEAAARLLNFGKAAAELRISPSALSRQIALLEKSHGHELFVRSTRRVVLTASGQNLFAAITRFEHDLDRASENAPLRIGCLESVFEFFLADLIAKETAVFAGQVDVTIETPEKLLELVTLGDLDFAITSAAPISSSSVSAFPLFFEDMTWIGSEKRRGREGDQRVIILSAFEKYCEKELQSADRIRINSFHATMALSRRGVGQALVALPAAKKTGRKTEGSQKIFVVMPNYQRLPDRLKAVVSLLQRHG